MSEKTADRVISKRLHLGQIILWSLLFFLCAVTLVLSQLDNLTTGEVYGAVSQAFNIDLRSLGVRTEQISDAGHGVAGFVLFGVAQLAIRRWWVLPLALVFFLGVEVAQLFSVERQASWMDVLRGWGGVLAAWVLFVIGRMLGIGRAKSYKS